MDLALLALQVSQPLHLEDPIVAARMVIDGLTPEGQDKSPIVSELDAFVVLNSFLQALLDNDLYAEAARLLWKPSVFTAEPSSVREIFDALFTESQVLVQGAASMGKSFSIGVWMYLDWRMDPANTNIQIVGPSENHLKMNLFSHLINLHNSSAIPGPGTVTDMCIALNPHDKYAGIKGIVIPLGKKSAGRLQGVKVKPRETPHPTLGNMTRLRVVLEEAENIHVGVWEDIINLSANAANKQQFKVVGAYNPKDRASQVGVRAEPVGGWQAVDMETSRKWWSKRGWLVIRLDGHRSENVLLGWEKFPGMQTKMGLETLTLNAGGQFTAGWYTMARGWYPEEGVDSVVIPAGLLTDEECRGEFIFMEEPENVMSADSALEGGDNVIVKLGRYGRASGIRLLPTLTSPKGEVKQFVDANGRRTFKWALQVDQRIPLPKGRTEAVGDNIIRVAKTAGVKPGWLGIDRTGNGAGIHDYVRAKYGDAVHGINASTSSTEMRILAEDKMLPCDEYNRLVTELWFAVRKWLQVGAMKFGFGIPGEPLFSELSGRRFIQPMGNPKVTVEPKKAYMTRGNKSPDSADACTMLLHVVRLNTHVVQSFKAEAARGENDRPMKQRLDVTNLFQSLDD
jgi:hypothetical protein